MPSPQSLTLAFTEYHPETGADLWVTTLGADPSSRIFLRTPFSEYGPMFSPDGRWIAYTSDESGRNEVYVLPFPGPGGKWQISIEGGAEPIWSRDGRELFYRSGSQMMRLPVTTDPSFAAGTPQPLFEGRYLEGTMTGLPVYDVVANGQQFLMIGDVGQQSAPDHLMVVLDWFADLAR